MNTPLADLLALRDSTVEQAAEALGASAESLHRISGYGHMEDIDAIDAVAAGARLLLKDGQIVLIYLGPDGIPDDVDHDHLTRMFPGPGAKRRSRQGKRAHLHIHAQQGIAWSEKDGEVGFIEIFPPTNLRDYEEWVYLEPPPFRQ